MRALAVVAALSGAAYADGAINPSQPSPIEPAASRAGDANLEPLDKRAGVTFSVALGGSFTLGGGVVGVGSGGVLSLCLGHVATPTTVITLDLVGSAQLHRVGANGALAANKGADALVGAQHWIGPSLWVRLGVGIGNYVGDRVALPGGQMGTITLVGPAGGAAIGVELLRWKSVVVGIEADTVAVIEREGLLSTSGLILGLSFD